MFVEDRRTITPKHKPDSTNLGFAQHLSDHQLVAYYYNRQWSEWRIVPCDKPLPFGAAAAVLHNGTQLLEGISVTFGDDGRLRIFRPHDHFRRMRQGGHSVDLCPPEPRQAVEAICRFVAYERDWVPRLPKTVLYLRPICLAISENIGVGPSPNQCFIVVASPSGPLHTKPLTVRIEQHYARAWPDGFGTVKTGANYLMAKRGKRRASEEGCDEVMWTRAPKHTYVEEIGTANAFCYRVRGRRRTIITPELGDGILAGITRESALTLFTEMGYDVEERPLSVKELVRGVKDGTIRGVFATGTAAVVSHITELRQHDERYTVAHGEPCTPAIDLRRKLYDIRQGKDDKRGWTVIVP
jgi:branched-chain amino acid aminotransferase